VLSRVTRLVLASLVLLAAASVGHAQQPNTPDSYQPTLDRLKSLTVLPLKEWRYSTDTPHPEDLGLDDSSWQTMTTGDKWSNGARVLRRWVEIPEKINGYPIAKCRVLLNLQFGSDDEMGITVFNNGSVVYRGDEDMQQPILLTESAQPGQKFLIAARVNSNPVETLLRFSELTIETPGNRIDPAFLRQEILAARPLISAYAEGKEERQGHLDAAVRAIDFTSLEHGDTDAFENSLRSAQAHLMQLDPWLKNFTIRAVGNAHIDMAWLWPWTETVEVVRNTFRSALDLMREYPDFRFTMSSARTYVWMEEKYPDLFQEIQKRAKEGRWEVIGGMWVEPDLNMPGGESLTRQILIGKRYFQQKFGVDVKIGWNPDSFGYNWQLPQIYKKSGIDYFVTQKLLWAHEYTTFPYKLFWWEAPDGSRILTYFPHDYAGGIDPVSLGKDLSIWTPSIYGPELKNKPVIMHLYGVGDHGGGPTRTMLDEAVRWQKPDAAFPKLEFSTATEFFKELDNKLPSLNVPSWRDELYFQYHRGVFTTQAETKKRIRSGEELLLNAEKFSSLANVLYHKDYPSQDFDTAWKALLFDDFHDIFPGSGIGVNYLDAKRNLEDVDRLGNKILHASLEEISAHTNTQGPGVPVQVFNPLAWPRREVVEIEAQLPHPTQQVEVVDAAGKAVDSQLLGIDGATHRARVLMFVDVPSLGFKTYFLRAATKPNTSTNPVKATDEFLENEFVRLKVDRKTGCMTSLFDKKSGHELLAAAETDTGGPKGTVCGNLLQTFVDKPKQWDAWNIDADFERQHWDLDSADEVRLVENGPLRAVIRVKQHFQNSIFVRDITLLEGSPRVDVKTEVDWHEQHILLKVAFPLSAHNDKATFEIPYGSVQRPTTRRTPAEQAEFEVPAVQWADLSDEQHGFSLLNDCKYGYDAKGNVLRLSLLRSPVWPDPQADQGHHEFTYSLYPHGGTWREAQTVHQGYELNYKLLWLQVAQHEGSLGPEHSFVQVENPNVVLTAVKKAEDSDALVLRFYEWAGKQGDIKIKLPRGAAAARETDLMERQSGELSLSEGLVAVPTKPYEIKTVGIDFRTKSSATSDSVSVEQPNSR
jgi:alpha-mannosidase